MALTLNNFVGFETGGLEEVSASTGSPTAQTSVVRTGSYALQAAGERVDIDLVEGGTSDAGDQYIVGFAYHVSDKTPASESHIVRGSGASSINFSLRLQTDGDVVLWDETGTTRGTATDPLTENKWHYFELLWENLASGDFIVYLDGSEIINVTNQDFHAEDLTRYIFWGPSTTGAYFDDVYMMSGATGTGDFLGPRTEVLGAYQNTAEDATDQGSALNNGTWANVGQTPFNDGTVADYQQNGAIAGYTICDEGNRAGPAGDAPGTITGAKYIHRMARTNGSSPTTLDKSYGNSVDGVTSKDMASVLLVTYANFFEVSEAAGVVPTNSENFAFGMGQTGSGGRDVLAHEMCAMLLHTQPALSTTLADMNFPDQNYYLGPFGT
jgi:hypothetical protein